MSLAQPFRPGLRTLAPDRRRSGARACLLGTALHAPARDGLEPGGAARLIVVGGDGRISGRSSRPIDRQRRTGAPPRRRLGNAGADRAGGRPATCCRASSICTCTRRNGRNSAALDRRSRTGCRRTRFPLEARYADLGLRQRVYESLVDALLANGTTTALYFATIHLAATRVLADICLSARRSAR